MDYTYSIEQLQLQLWNLKYANWIVNLFTVRWYFLIALVIGMYVVWWFLVDKTRLRTLLLYGSFVAVIRIILDIIGSNMGLWEYSVSILPLSPPMFVHDLTVTPLVYILVYQYSPTWKQFWFYNTIASAAVFFGLLPLLSYFGMLKFFNWNYYYSFAIVFLAAGVMRAIMLLIFRIEHAAQSRVKHTNLGSLAAQPAMKQIPDEKNDDNN